MNILILEDNAERIKHFRDCLMRKHSVTFATSVSGAKDWFSRLDIDVVFIDHDLDDRVYVDSEEENTGYQFAKWLSEHKLSCTFITHTMNSVGAKRICDVLPQCQHVPFHILSGLLEKGLVL